MNDYDPGLLNDFGGGNVDWWHDYIRAKLERCNDFWRAQIEAAQQSVQADGLPIPPKVTISKQGQWLADKHVKYRRR